MSKISQTRFNSWLEMDRALAEHFQDLRIAAVRLLGQMEILEASAPHSGELWPEDKLNFWREWESPDGMQYGDFQPLEPGMEKIIEALKAVIAAKTPARPGWSEGGAT